MIRLRPAAAIGAATLLGVAVLAGCSSGSTTDSSTSASAAASASTQMLPPVIIAEDQNEATAKVGDYLDILVPADQLDGTTVATDRPDLVELTQASNDGSATFNPGGRTLAAGTAIITVTYPDGGTHAITLTITE